MTEQEEKRLDEINAEIASGNIDPKLFNERDKILKLGKVKIFKGKGKHLAGWK